MYEYGVAPTWMSVSGTQFWRPMAGDFVVPQSQFIVKKTHIEKKYFFPISHLFQEETEGEEAWNLSEEGRERLEHWFEKANYNGQKIRIEGYWDTIGNRQKAISFSYLLPSQ